MKKHWFDLLMLLILIGLVIGFFYVVFFTAQPDPKIIAKLAVLIATYLFYFLRKLLHT